MLYTVLQETWERAQQEAREAAAQKRAGNVDDIGDNGQLYMVAPDWRSTRERKPPKKWYRRLEALRLKPYASTGTVWDNSVVLVPNSRTLAKAVAQLALDCGATEVDVFNVAHVVHFKSELMERLEALDAQYAQGGGHD